MWSAGEEGLVRRHLDGTNWMTLHEELMALVAKWRDQADDDSTKRCADELDAVLVRHGRSSPADEHRRPLGRDPR